MTRMSKKVALIIFFIFSLLPIHSLDLSDTTNSLADSFESFVDPNEGMTTFRSLNIPVGARAESLGTACTAICDDIIFFDYNPAASAVMSQTEIALFHNAWIADSAMETLSYTTRDKNFGYGAQLKCFYVPFTEYNLFGERVTGSYYSESSATFNVAYNFFSGYNFKGLAVGANFRGSWRSVPDYTDNKTNEIISGSGLSQSALGLMTDIGFLLRFDFFKEFADRNPNLNIGLSISNLGVSFTGFGKEIKKDDPLPTRINAGLSYRIFSPLMLCFEFRKPINIQDFGSSETWSCATGVEISVTNFFNFDAGFLLQGGNPRISMGSTFLIKKVQLGVNYTFDLTSSQNPINHISLSAKLRLGDKGRSKIQEKVDEHYIAGLALYALGDLESAIKQWDIAISLDNTFDPAIDAKTAAIRFEKAKKEIMDMQSFDITEGKPMKKESK